jgi:hypothetical protein
MYNSLIDTVVYHLEISCPKKVIKQKVDKKIKWLTDDIRSKKQQLLETYSEWIETKSEVIKANYTKQKKEYRLSIKKAKASYVEEQINASGNPNKTAWSFVNQIRNKSKIKDSKNIVLELGNGKTDDPSRVSNTFNNFFLNFAQGNANKHCVGLAQNQTLTPPLDPTITLTDFRAVTGNELDSIIRSMSNSNSAGWDGISNKIIK